MKTRGGANAMLVSMTNSSEDLGFYMATIYLIIGIIISVGMIGIAIYLLITKGKYSGDTIAVVQKSSCKQKYSDEAGRTQKCTANIVYSVNSKTYNNTIPVGETEYTNKQIDIMYDSKNPNDIQKKNYLRRNLGLILIIIAIIIIAIVWTRYYLLVVKNGSITSLVEKQ
jgi:hypothetical protein